MMGAALDLLREAAAIDARMNRWSSPRFREIMQTVWLRYGIDYTALCVWLRRLQRAVPMAKNLERNVIFPAFGYWEIDGNPVSGAEAQYGAHPRARWLPTELAENYKGDYMESSEDMVQVALASALAELAELKTDERSERNRRLAIVNTQVEGALAYYMYFVVQEAG